jgi:hypothetical protein
MSIEKFMKRFVGISLLLLLGTSLMMTGRYALAQANFGSIVGTVTDTTGADVPGATVTLTNKGTNASLTTKAGSGGTYSFLNLTPGFYTVTIKNAGFKTFTQTPVDVQIGGTARVNAALTVGDVSQTVTVESSTVTQLDTDTSSLGGVVEGEQVVESPLNGRDVNNLLDFVPGVVPGPYTQGSTFANGGSGNFQAGGQTQAISYGDYQIGGGFSGQSLFFVDGVLSNIPENNVNSIVPTQDSVQEFRVSTNNVTAEFGGFAGGVVQISTKQGTNKYHGSIYEYFRNTVLDANDYFSNHSGPNGAPLPRPPLHQNQYGVNVGGPLIKDKLFFFFSFERETLTSGGLDTTTVPTTAELGGDFSALTASAVSSVNPTGQLIYNPSTGAPFAGCDGTTPNVICTSQTPLDPVAQKILALESPVPTNSKLTNNYIANAPIEGAQNQFDARVDYNPNGKDQIFAKYTFWNPHNGPSDPLHNDTGAGPTGNTTTEAVVGDNHIFNPSTIADLRLSYLENYNYQVPLSNGFDQSTIGPNYGTLQGEQVNGHQGLLPGLGVGYGIGAELSQLYWLNTAYSINGSITKVKGRHTIKVGGIGRQIEWTSFANNQGLGISASNGFTACPSATCGASLNGSTGNALASFLLGIPSGVGITEVGTTHSFLHSYGFYGVDTWQVNNKLTLNLGIRWEQPGSYSEVNNLDTVLQPNMATSLPSFTNPVTGATSPTVGGLAFVASPQYPSRREEALHWKLFSPREGFDYRIDNTTVVRGGYGIAFLPAELTADGPGSSSINSAGTGIGNNVGQTLLTTVDNPFPNGINTPAGRSQTALTQLLGQGIGSRIPNQKYGYAQQYNFGFEHSFDKKSVFTVSYAGAKGTHLVLSQGYTGTGLNLDQLPDQYDSIGGAPPQLNAQGVTVAPGTGLFTAVANPYSGLLSPGTTLDQPTVYEGYLLRPFPQYGSVSQSVPRYGASTYNALQLTFKRTFVNNGIFQVAYTYAKLLSNTDNTSSFDDDQGGQGVAQDNTNLQAEKSLSLQDLRHNLVINYGLDLPFGKGHQFLSNSNGLVNALVGGWRMAGITTFHSGVPIAIQTGGNDYTNYLGLFGAGPIRPNIVPGCNRNVSGSQQSKANHWINQKCFTLPGEFAFGNENRVDSQLRTAGAANFDLSASKIFKVYERVTGKLSVEAFNLFNRAQFAAPDSGLTDGTIMRDSNNNVLYGSNFGVVTRQANPARELQLAARFTF